MLLMYSTVDKSFVYFLYFKYFVINFNEFYFSTKTLDFILAYINKHKIDLWFGSKNFEILNLGCNLLMYFFSLSISISQPLSLRSDNFKAA